MCSIRTVGIVALIIAAIITIPRLLQTPVPSINELVQPTVVVPAETASVYTGNLPPDNLVDGLFSVHVELTTTSGSCRVTVSSAALEINPGEWPDLVWFEPCENHSTEWWYAKWKEESGY